MLPKLLAFPQYKEEEEEESRGDRPGFTDPNSRRVNGLCGRKPKLKQH